MKSRVSIACLQLCAGKGQRLPDSSTRPLPLGDRLSFRTQRGNPVLICLESEQEMVTVPMEDDSILVDLDTAEDYQWPLTSTIS